jgi:hypothetical protein
MEKTITFSRSEMMQLQQLEMERQQLLAQIGEIMLNLESARKSLDTCNEKRNQFVRGIILNNGIGQFKSVRPTENGMVVIIPDEEPEPQIAKVNGGIDAHEKSAS